jgi:hypothetical protein
MQHLSENRARPRRGRALGRAAAAVLCVAALCQPNLAFARGHGGGGHGGGFHGGGFHGGFHGGGFHHVSHGTVANVHTRTVANVHNRKRCWGKGFATEAAFGALEYAWEKLRLSQVYAGHHPHNRASEKILKKLGFEFIENVFYEPTGWMHPSYVCKAPPPRRNTFTARNSSRWPRYRLCPDSEPS